MIKKLIFSSAFFCCLCIADAQQLRTPSPSPTQSIKQEFGISSVELTYSRPNVRNRKIFGDLVPFGRLWRTGANAATRIKFADDVMVGGTSVKAGDYVLYTIPNQNEWEVVLNKGINNWGVDGYQQSEDVARIKIKPIELPFHQETFTMQFINIKPNGADLRVMWERTGVEIPITMDVDAKVMAQINNVMGRDNRPYFQAAMYYLESGKDLTQAVQWFDKAIEQNPDAFWVYHQKANALVKLNRKEEARQTAMKSIELAKKQNNNDYVRLNENLLKNLK